MANSSDVKILVIGAGGGGNNAINNMIEAASKTDVEFLAVNTDRQALDKNQAKSHILLTTKNKKSEGLGAGAKPEVGAEAAENSIEQIKEYLDGTDMVFIAAGLGGGTGTGAAPVIAKFAKDLGILTVGVVTKPFTWEGKKRADNSKAGLERLREATDALIEIPNDRVVDVSQKKTTLIEAFKLVDDVLKQGVLGVTELITKSGYINLDFADVQTIIKDAGKAHMGIGVYKITGEEENAVQKATELAINSPLLETSINGAKRIIVNYASKHELGMIEIADANNMIYNLVDDDVNLIWGAAQDGTMEDGEIKVTVIAADFRDSESPISTINVQTPQKQDVSMNNTTSQPSQPSQPSQSSQLMNSRQDTLRVPRDFDASKFQKFARRN